MGNVLDCDNGISEFELLSCCYVHFRKALTLLSLQLLIRTPCAPSYIIVLRPLNSNRLQSMLSPDILDRMHLLFTPVHFLFWLLGRVGGQYATPAKVDMPLNKEAKPNQTKSKLV